MTAPQGYPYGIWDTAQLTSLIESLIDTNTFDGAVITNSTIDSSAIGGSSAAAAHFTTLNASSTTGLAGATTISGTLSATNTVTLSPASHNVAISPTGTGTVTISPAGALTISPTAASTLDNTAIGSTTPALGQFTYVGRSAATGLSAAGTSRTDATQLAKAVNVLSTVASGTGVILPAISSAGVGAEVVLVNGGANTVAIYGSGSNTIDGTAGATGITMAATHRAMFIATSSSTWISVLLGAVAS